MGYRRVVGGVLAAVALLGSGAVASAAAPEEAAAACTWRATALSVPAGEIGSVATTDRAGGFTGQLYELGKRSHVGRWKDGRYTDLGQVEAGWATTVEGENSSGVIVGSATVTLPIGGIQFSDAFRSNNGVLEKLPEPEPAEGSWQSNSAAVGVTDAGDVYGWVGSTAVGQASVIRWPAARPGTYELIPQTSVRPVDVDPAGAVLMDSRTVWRDGVNTTLSTPSNMKSWQATKISNGHVVGYGVTTSDQKVSLYWNQQNVAHVLPRSSYNLSGGPGPSINSAGRVIARLDLANGGNDQTGTGFGVWDQGKFVSQFGDAKLDLPVVVGDDGSVGGYRRSGNETRPYSWRCS